MKNFTLFVAAAALATSAFAQMPQQREAITLQKQHVQQFKQQHVANHKVARQHASKNLFKSQPISAKAAEEFNIITEAEGTEKLYARSGFAWANSMFGVMLADQEGMAASVVYAEDGKTVYIKNPIAFLTADTYAVGTLNEEGTEITVDLEQMLVYFEEEGYGMKLAMLNIYEDEEGNATYVKDEEATQAIFKIVDGSLVLQDTDDEFSYESINYPTRIFGAVYEDIDPEYDEGWAGYGDLKTVMNEAIVDPVVAPEGLEVSEWLLSYAYDTEGARDGRIVKGGIADSILYLKGFNDNDPEMWIQAFIDGDQLRVPDHQYLGVAEGMFAYLMNGKTEMMYDEYYDEWYLGFNLTGEDVILSYDAEAKTFTYTDEEDVMVINAGDQMPNAFYVYLQPKIEPFVEMPGIPQDPEILYFEDVVAEMGLGLMQCYIPLYTVDGYFMNPDKLYYRLYIKMGDEIELYPLYTDEYLELEEDMDEIPYNFTDGWDIEIAGSYIYFYQTGYDLMGIQSINRNGGEKWQSNIVWYDGTFDEASGVDAIRTINAAAHTTQVYDLMGRKSAGQKGLVIIRKGAETSKALMK